MNLTSRTSRVKAKDSPCGRCLKLALDIVDDAGCLAAPDPGDVVLVLEERAERVVDHVRRVRSTAVARLRSATQSPSVSRDGGGRLHAGDPVASTM